MSLSKVDYYWRDMMGRYEESEKDHAPKDLLNEIRASAGMSLHNNGVQDDMLRTAAAVVDALSFCYDSEVEAFNIVSAGAGIDLAGTDLEKAVRLGERGDTNGLAAMLSEILDHPVSEPEAVEAVMTVPLPEIEDVVPAMGRALSKLFDGKVTAVQIRQLMKDLEHEANDIAKEINKGR